MHNFLTALTKGNLRLRRGSRTVITRRMTMFGQASKQRRRYTCRSSAQERYQIARELVRRKSQGLNAQRNPAKLEKLPEDREGQYHPMTGIKLDPYKLKSVAAFVGAYAHELLHAKDGPLSGLLIRS